MAVRDFVGAKAALFCGDCVLTLQRDDIDGLAWAGHWDLPGGGREEGETPEDCVLREISEEVGLHLPVVRLVYRQELPSMVYPDRMSWLFGGWLDRNDIAAIRLGDEGQGWAMMPLGAFMSHDSAIPEMQRRAGLVWEVLGRPVP